MMTHVSDSTKPAALKKNRNFVLLCAGSLISMLGDQLTLIALPWLVLHIFEEPWVLGSVMACMAIPMSILMLFGGNLVDRFSSKKILLVSKLLNSVLFVALSLLVYLQVLTLPLLYMISLFIGLSGALAIPAATALLPSIVERTQLSIANGIGVTLRSLTTLLGPLIAALLLSLQLSALDNEPERFNHLNLAMIFLLDACSFLLSMIFVSLIFQLDKKYDSKKVRGLSQGFSYFWHQKELRKLMLYIALVTSCLGGLMQVGLPVMIKSTWLQGADSFGYVMAAFAAGNIIGAIAVSKVSSLKLISIGTVILLTDILVGFLLVLLSATKSSFHGAILLFLMGMFAGYTQVRLISWIQRQIPLEVMGRVMSIVMFCLVGLLPLSAMFFGLMMQLISSSEMFFIGGIMLLCIALIAWFFSSITKIGSCKSIVKNELKKLA
ncbi:MFS transporter [Pleionea mediterranea]|uniref:MFS transporter n=1 Tax=Pleionea mediterranea TaxID=523701 RepID=A0A316FE24_9GAMM|nr:MFS transporter [Pleionea mediterranea]PWK45414.1 MFS transporter [Pleionea mediterranea]